MAGLRNTYAIAKKAVVGYCRKIVGGWTHSEQSLTYEKRDV
jgi:hypothetical protein